MITIADASMCENQIQCNHFHQFKLCILIDHLFFFCINSIYFKIYTCHISCLVFSKMLRRRRMNIILSFGHLQTSTYRPISNQGTKGFNTTKLSNIVLCNHYGRCILSNGSMKMPSWENELP